MNLNEIFIPYRPVENYKAYCKQLAKDLEFTIYDYYFDNLNKLQFPSNSDIYKFKEFRQYDWRKIQFKLTNATTIQRMGLQEYVRKNRELVFNLTIKGYSFLYVCKFSPENDMRHGHVDNDTKIVYAEDNRTGQLSFVL